jgi:hypothetical protein
MKASGTFEVNLQPLASFAGGSDGIKLGRMSIEKTFRGKLSASSKGEMLTAVAPAALRHRRLLNFEDQTEGIRTYRAVADLIEQVSRD